MVTVIRKKGGIKKDLPEVFGGPPAPNPFAPKKPGFSKPPVTGITIGTPAPSPIKPTTTAQKVAEIMGTLPANEKTQGFTQAMLDEARKQGIDVFDPKNLRKISAIEQGAQANLSAQEQAVADFLMSEEANTTQTNAAAELDTQMRENQPMGVLGTALGMKSEPTRAMPNEIIPRMISGAAEIFDGLRALTTLGGRKSTRVQAAEAAFTDASTILKSNIELVKTGQMQSYQALKAFDLANEAINRLQRTNTGIGKLNLRYWIDEGGKETEVSIIREQAEIATLRIELLNAIAAGAIA